MNTSFLTKYLSKLSLIINLVLTVMLWFWCIGTSNPDFFNLMQAYTFLPADTIKVATTIIFVIWVIRSITAYEAKVIQFTQADLLKQILSELKSSERRNKMNEIDKAKDRKVNFDDVDI
ncbi:TPA: hypothetical protein ACJI8J_002000 [Kluyvera georgiana]|nr:MULTISPECIES: hypothetical protein [Enterobacteriaceae]EIZ9117499.1 hypothetical protein [Escherichia coli]HCE8954269.1 hypothetical protein [Raoultella ornithinolytica]HDR2471180.1 hypothetical protein [Enterobacter soli]HDR2812967.1 hypothetical protein [Enterobacter asburiae]MCE9891420.1 hypothetical protein [Kluyvera intermedia]